MNDQGSHEMRILTEKWKEIESTVQEWLRHRFDVTTQITVCYDQVSTRHGTRSIVPVYDGNGTLGVVILDHHDHPVSIIWVTDDDSSYTAV